jgi:hypothetical protein
MPTNPSLPVRLRPVNGSCRWVSRRHHVLRINTVLYTVVPVGTRYRLLNWNTGSTYDIDAAGRWCTCPSFIWDHCPVQANGDGRCKHIAALLALRLLADGPGRPSAPNTADDFHGGEVLPVGASMDSKTPAPGAQLLPPAASTR